MKKEKKNARQKYMLKKLWTDLIKATNLERDILNPALATASTRNDASTVLNDFVLQS